MLLRGFDFILRVVLLSDRVYLFVPVPPKIAISDLVRNMKGRSSHKVQREFPALRRRYWGRQFWSRGYSTTNGDFTEYIVRNTPKTTSPILPISVGSRLACQHDMLARINSGGMNEHVHIAYRPPASDGNPSKSYRC